VPKSEMEIQRLVLFLIGLLMFTIY